MSSFGGRIVAEDQAKGMGEQNLMSVFLKREKTEIPRIEGR